MDSAFQSEVVIQHAEYHRNGVAGEGFCAAVVSGVLVDETEPRHLLVTFGFKVDEDSSAPDPYSCRVVDVNDPAEHWRGDVFGYELCGPIYDSYRARMDARLAAIAALRASTAY